jgi:filamentous hemagglutinin family protein
MKNTRQDRRPSARPATRPARFAPSPAPRLLPVAMACAALLHTPLMAQPVPTQLPVLRPGGAVINAQVGTPTGGTNPSLAITQTPSGSNRGLIEWQSFSIGRDASVNITQPNAQSVLINRVTGDTGGRSASEIYGSLNANGRVFLVNPAGVIFGPGAQVNVGALVATTLDMTDAMTADNYRGAIEGNGPIGLRLDGSAARVDVLEGARIAAADGGSVALVGSEGVRQHGAIEAARGRVQLAATNSAEVVLPLGTSGFVDLVLRPAQGAQVQVGGTVSVASATGPGGQVELQGDAIELTGSARVNADGATGGGRILVGGDDTRAINVRSGAMLSADATERGDGGEVTLRAMYQRPGNVARSDFGVTEMYGDIRARGGLAGGNGGRVETSGVAVNTSLTNSRTGIVSRGHVDASARHNSGINGTWTLDPYNVTISGRATTSVDGSFNPTAGGANINAADISAALNAGTNVVVTTGTAATGTEAGTITVDSGTSISRTGGAGTATLTLQAHSDIYMYSGATIQGSSAAPVNVNLHADIDGQGGGSVQLFNSSILTGGGNIDIGGGNLAGTGRATGNGQMDGVLLSGATLDATGAGTRGNIAIRGGAPANSFTSGITLSESTLIGRNITLDGLGAVGYGVRMTDFSGYGGSISLDTDSGLIDIRGVASSGSAGYGGPIVGVELNRADIALGTAGSLRVAGLATDNTGSPTGQSAGVRFRATRIVADAANTRTVTLVGELAGTAGGLGGLAFFNTESGRLSINGGFDDSTGAERATGANVVLGGSSSTGDALNLLSFGYGFTVNTTGSVNLRPLNVNASGNIVEQPGTAIDIGARNGGFFVDTDLLRPVGVENDGITAGRGIVVGSSAHTGRIQLHDGALFEHDDLSLVLQNQGTGSQGLVVGDGNTLRNLALRTTGNVSQTSEGTGGITVTGTLLVEGGTSSRIDLSQPENRIANLTFDPPDRFTLVTADALNIGGGTASGFTPGTGFAPLTITSNLGGNAAFIEAGGNINITAPIGMTGATGSLVIVAPATATINLSEGVTVTAPGGGLGQLWAGTINQATTPSAPATNLYGCDFAASSTTCAGGTVQVPTTGNFRLRAGRPTVNVTATATGTASAPTFTLSTTDTLPNGDTLAGILSGTPTIAANGQQTAAGTLASPTGYLINFIPGSVNFSSPVVPTLTPYTSYETRSGFMTDLRTDVYGRNLASPFICTAASLIKDGVAVEQRADPLASEWGKVRSQPQLSGCLDVTAGGQCSAF